MGLTVFAGDLFLRLARTGALVLEPGHADRLIADLTATLTVVRARREPEQALEELPKYIEAFRIAKGVAEPAERSSTWPLRVCEDRSSTLPPD